MRRIYGLSVGHTCPTINPFLSLEVEKKLPFIFIKQPCHPESVENKDLIRNFQAVQDLTKNIVNTLN